MPLDKITIGTQGPGEFVLEAAAIGQVGDGVETRHAIDLELRVAPLGDVLDDDDRSLVLHPVDGDFEGASVSRLERNHDVRPAIAVEQGVREMGVLRGRDDVAVDEAPEDRVHMGADESDVRAHSEDSERLIVHQDQAAAPVEHAKTMRHVVERGVQSRRQRRGPLLRGDHFVEIGPQTLRRALHVENERHDADDNSHRIPSARDDHRHAQRNKRHDELHVDAAEDGVAARHQAEGVGDRHRYADKLGEAVVGYGERQQSPQRKAEQTEERAEREDAFLLARDFDGGARHAPRMAPDKVEPKRRDQELRGGGVEEHGLPGCDRAGDFAEGDRDRGKQNHRDHVRQKTVDEGDIDLVRQLVGRR